MVIEMNIEGSKTSGQSQDIDEMIASFLPNKPTGAGERNEQRKAPRFRVKWHADILTEEQSTHHGFINDISTLGASFYLGSSLHTKKCTLHIHVPPLDLKNESHIMEVSGKVVYEVYDGDQQLFRAAINFLRFNPESDLEYLRQRLTK
jgi:hypothetical protein